MHNRTPKTLNCSFRKFSRLCAGREFKPFFIIKRETIVFKELLLSVSAHGVSMLCHNILSERQVSIPQ